jgi:hypothetical protein
MEGPDIELRANGSEIDPPQQVPKGPGCRNPRFLDFGGDAGNDPGEGSSNKNTWDRTEAFDPAATQTPHTNLGKQSEEDIL